MKLKYTPGPWEKDYGMTDGHIKSLNGKNKLTPTVCRYQNYEGQITHFFCADSLTIEEVEANGRLISAAPEMLEALIKATQDIDNLLKDQGDSILDYEGYNKYFQIIEKATGLTIEEVLK
jgi:hypothetical protein